jgi:hypothetical protein
MGLDITAISEISPVDLPEGMEKWSDEYYDWEAEQGMTLWSVYRDSNFSMQGEGLPDSDLVSSEGESYSFRAGSYSGYGEWRNDLALAAGYEGGSEGVWNQVDRRGMTGRPFEELINFPDNDGLIGPVISEKLYNDFVTQEKAIMHTIDWWYLKMVPEKEYDGDEVNWFKTKYNDWKVTFDVARNNGMVIFH